MRGRIAAVGLLFSAGRLYCFWEGWSCLMLDGKLNEACAVFGVSLFSKGEAPGICYNALLSMQHRGQEGAGIAVTEGNAIICQKNVGLVGEVFSARSLESFPRSDAGIGHARYSTTGSNTLKNVQPFVTEYLTGRLAIAHNGNVTNAREIRESLIPFGLDFSASSDSEVISSLIAYRTLKTGDLFKGVQEAAKELVGAYSLVVLGSGGKLVAIRDPGGYRPLCIGENELGVAVASESCALDNCGFRFLRDIEPGEAVLIENGRIVKRNIFLSKEKKSMCIFEFVYFARPDSVLDGLSVYEARVNMGRTLAKEHPVKADLVCGVPDSGLDAAVGYALESGIPLTTGFVKNPYIGRSFIFPTQHERENAVNMKLTPLSAAVRGKSVVLVDDSIVRGTTSPRIISAMRRAGAKEVHMRVSAPPFTHTCYFGTDIGDESRLLANRLAVAAICERIGADTLGYISVEGLRRACAGCKLDFCTGCFTGHYETKVGEFRKELLEGK